MNSRNETDAVVDSNRTTFLQKYGRLDAHIVMVSIFIDVYNEMKKNCSL